MCGLDNVYLKNGYTIVTDEEHGGCISITNADTLHKCIVRSLVSVERRLSFAELDFLRKAMDMDTKAFFLSIGSVCGITPWISVGEECLFLKSIVGIVKVRVLCLGQLYIINVLVG
jgi:hypothetical protein